MAPLDTYPLDLVVEILAKLPVKSLLRFRCVSKSCDLTITDPFFSKLHQPRPCLFIADLRDDPFFLRCLSKEALLADSCDGAVTNVPAPWTDGECEYNLFGCCNGLISLYNGCTGESTVWNPSTRKFKTLPRLDPPRDNLYLFYGFGYDEVTDDYKVVQGFVDKESTNVGDDVFTFSLKSDAWRRIPDSNICPSVPADSYGVLVGGALHWLAISGDIIIVFDLGKEKYEGLPRPEIGNSKPVIGVLGEQLCLCSSKCLDGKGVDVWMMKEYGVKSSWTKMFQFPHETLSRHVSGYNVIPFLFSKEDEIVAIVSGAGVAVVRCKCNTRDLRLKDVMLWPSNSNECAFLYTESLVSPLVSHQA